MLMLEVRREREERREETEGGRDVIFCSFS
jgi:hypothetical protein